MFLINILLALVWMALTGNFGYADLVFGFALGYVVLWPARGLLGGACVTLGGAALAIMPYVANIPLKIGLTTIGVALPSVIYVIGNTVIGEITPLGQRGALLAIEAANDRIEVRHEQQCRDCADDNPADHRAREHRILFLAGAADCHRRHTDDHRGSGHQHRTDSGVAGA